jgi:hypothetical protein
VRRADKSVQHAVALILRRFDDEQSGLLNGREDAIGGIARFGQVDVDLVIAFSGDEVGGDEGIPAIVAGPRQHRDPRSGLIVQQGQDAVGQRPTRVIHHLVVADPGGIPACSMARICSTVTILSMSTFLIGLPERFRL